MGKIHKRTRGKSIKSLHQTSATPILKVSNQDTRDEISTVCLHFAFSIYCSNRLFCRTHMALHQLHLQNPKSFAERNQQSSCQQKSKRDGPITIAQAKCWLRNSSDLARLTKGSTSPLQTFILKFQVRISSPIEHACQKSMGLLLPLRNAEYISCIHRLPTALCESDKSSGMGFEQELKTQVSCCPFTQEAFSILTQDRPASYVWVPTILGTHRNSPGSAL